MNLLTDDKGFFQQGKSFGGKGVQQGVQDLFQNAPKIQEFMQRFQAGGGGAEPQTGNFVGTMPDGTLHQASTREELEFLGATNITQGGSSPNLIAQGQQPQQPQQPNMQRFQGGVS